VLFGRLNDAVTAAFLVWRNTVTIPSKLLLSWIFLAGAF
jgi:hypothetical protein